MKLALGEPTGMWMSNVPVLSYALDDSFRRSLGGVLVNDLHTILFEELDAGYHTNIAADLFEVRA